MKKSSLFKRALLVAGLSAFSSMASAALVATLDGNDCAGVFGIPFEECTVPAQYDPNESPIIIKFDIDPTTEDETEINSTLFPTIDGSEFDFSGFGSTGTWTYTPGPGDPAINFYVAKGGPGFNLFSVEDPLTGDWVTPTNPANGQPFGLSHLSFYDTERQEIPEPMTLLLLGAGLLGVGIARRRAKPE